MVTHHRTQAVSAMPSSLPRIQQAAAWGVMTLVWQNGHGSDEIFGVAAPAR